MRAAPSLARIWSLSLSVFESRKGVIMKILKMNKLVIVLALPLFILACENRTSRLEEARNDLMETRQEAAKNIQAAEDRLAKAIEQSEKNLSSAREDLKQTSENNPGSVSGSSQQFGAEFCRGLEVGGVSEAEQEAYQSCAQMGSTGTTVPGREADGEQNLNAPTGQ